MEECGGGRAEQGDGGGVQLAEHEGLEQVGVLALQPRQLEAWRRRRRVLAGGSLRTTSRPTSGQDYLQGAVLDEGR